MEDTVLSVSTLPDTLNRRFRSSRVRVREENGSIILTPLANSESSDLWGLLPEGLFTTDMYLTQKQQDKELES